MRDYTFTKTVKPYTVSDSEALIIKENRRLLAKLSPLIVHYRNLKGISRSTLASKVGCSVSMIRQLELNLLDYCGLSILSKVALYFDCSLLDWLQQPQATPQAKDVNPFVSP